MYCITSVRIPLRTHTSVDHLTLAFIGHGIVTDGHLIILIGTTPDENGFTTFVMLTPNDIANAIVKGVDMRQRSGITTPLWIDTILNNCGAGSALNNGANVGSSNWQYPIPSTAKYGTSLHDDILRSASTQGVAIPSNFYMRYISPNKDGEVTGSSPSFLQFISNEMLNRITFEQAVKNWQISSGENPRVVINDSGVLNPSDNPNLVTSTATRPGGLTARALPDGTVLLANPTDNTTNIGLSINNPPPTGGLHVSIPPHTEIQYPLNANPGDSIVIQQPLDQNSVVIVPAKADNCEVSFNPPIAHGEESRNATSEVVVSTTCPNAVAVAVTDGGAFDETTYSVPIDNTGTITIPVTPGENVRFQVVDEHGYVVKTNDGGTGLTVADLNDNESEDIKDPIDGLIDGPYDNDRYITSGAYVIRNTGKGRIRVYSNDRTLTLNNGQSLLLKPGSTNITGDPGTTYELTQPYQIFAPNIVK
ncbi:MAG: hypothetical protein WCO06_07040 [Candidatus Roizmanbacteria bacterium]